MKINDLWLQILLVKSTSKILILKSKINNQTRSYTYLKINQKKLDFFSIKFIFA